MATYLIIWCFPISSSFPEFPSVITAIVLILSIVWLVRTATAPVTTYYTTTYVPSTVYYEPDYVVIDGVRVYSDGTTIVDEDYAPDYILPDGSRVYSVPGTVEEDFAPDYVLPDGSRVYDLNNYNYEPDYVIINGVRVYSDGSVH